jgi:hypothetical protein
MTTNDKQPDTQMAIIGRVNACTCMFNGAVVQRQSATYWYAFNATENRWDALDNHAEIEAAYQLALREPK